MICTLENHTQSTLTEGMSGEYTILQNVGKGSYGNVYCAYHNKSGRLHALKAVLLEGLDEEERYQREREAEIMMMVSSNHIIKGHKTKISEGVLWVCVLKVLICKQFTLLD